jgi:hypothetical protein
LCQLDQVHTGGLYRRVPQERHRNEPSSFQIGVSRGRRMASSGMLALISQMAIRPPSSRIGRSSATAAPAEALHPQPPRISLGTVRLAGSLFCALPGVFGVHLCRADLPAPNDLARFGAPLRARAMPLGLDARNGHEAATGSVKCATSTRLPKIRSQSGTCSRSRTMPLARQQFGGLKLDEIGRAKGGSRGGARRGGARQGHV